MLLDAFCFQQTRKKAVRGGFRAVTACTVSEGPSQLLLPSQNHVQGHRIMESWGLWVGTVCTLTLNLQWVTQAEWELSLVDLPCLWEPGMEMSPAFLSPRMLTGSLSEPERKAATLKVGRGCCGCTGNQRPGIREQEVRNRRQREETICPSLSSWVWFTHGHPWSQVGLERHERVDKGHSSLCSMALHGTCKKGKVRAVSRQSSSCPPQEPRYQREELEFRRVLPILPPSLHRGHPCLAVWMLSLPSLAFSTDSSQRSPLYMV